MMTAVLFPEFQQRAHRYARCLVGNDWDAEEIVQEAFCKLARRESEGGGTGPAEAPAALLFTIIRHQAIDLSRKRQVRRRVPWSEIPEPSSRESGGSAASDLNELVTGIRAAFERLPPRWADALHLRVAGELSYEEIARVLECSHAQVRTWIYRARKQLATQLAAQGWTTQATGND